MFSFRNLPLQRKLTLLVLLTTGIALVLTCGAFIAYEVSVLPGRIANGLTTLADMIASGSTASLSFEDPKAARENLRTLSANSRVVSACIFDRNGKVFASYTRPGPGPEPCTAGVQNPGQYFSRNDLSIYRSINYDGENLGTRAE